MSIAVNLGRVVIMRQVADWLAKHATLPIDFITISEGGSVTVQPSSRQPGGEFYGGSSAEIHNLYAIAEEVGVEVSLTPREYTSGWYLTAAWQIGQIPVESQITVYRVAAAVRQSEPVESGGPEASAADATPELVAAHA